MGKVLAIGTAALLSVGVMAAPGLSDYGCKAFAQAASAEDVLGSSAFLDNPALRLDLLEAKRVDGGALMLRWHVTNTSGETGGLVSGRGERIRYYSQTRRPSWSDFYFIDPAENKKYHLLEDTAGNRIAAIFLGDYDPGTQRLNWAKFPAPPESSTSVTVHVSGFEPIFGVPVTE
jgi:hypothetical protein